MKQEKGMTIIATMLTIIILLILGVIVVYLLIGNTGLLERSGRKGNVYEQELVNKLKQENIVQKEFQPSNDLENYILDLGIY